MKKYIIPATTNVVINTVNIICASGDPSTGTPMANPSAPVVNAAPGRALLIKK